MAGDLSLVFGVRDGGLEPIAHAWSSNIALKSRRIHPISNRSDGNAREGIVTTVALLGGMVGVSLMALGARTRVRRRRSSIRGMLTGPERCAVRRRD
jgi:hypothetical protein